MCRKSADVLIISTSRSWSISSLPFTSHLELNNSPLPALPAPTSPHRSAPSLLILRVHRILLTTNPVHLTSVTDTRRTRVIIYNGTFRCLSFMPLIAGFWSSFCSSFYPLSPHGPLTRFSFIRDLHPTRGIFEFRT